MRDQDRRQYERIGLDAKIQYRIATFQDKHGPTRNISRGGICFSAQEKIDIGRLLHLELDVPDKEKGGSSHIEGIGEVMWQEYRYGNYLTGVKFIKV
jgi:hypothetical protein